MKRIIKFRALIRFGNSAGNWKYVTLGEGAIGTSMSDLSIYLNNDDCLLSSLSQFTGLKDKKGKEIYEGDVIKHPFAESPEDKGFLVVYDVFKYRFLNMYFLDVNSELYEIEEDSIDYIKEIEIIGNIHENPELLSNE